MAVRAWVEASSHLTNDSRRAWQPSPSKVRQCRVGWIFWRKFLNPMVSIALIAQRKRFFHSRVLFKFLFQAGSGMARWIQVTMPRFKTLWKLEHFWVIYIAREKRDTSQKFVNTLEGVFRPKRTLQAPGMEHTLSLCMQDCHAWTHRSEDPWLNDNANYVSKRCVHANTAHSKHSRWYQYHHASMLNHLLIIDKATTLADKAAAINVHDELFMIMNVFPPFHTCITWIVIIMIDNTSEF